MNLCAFLMLRGTVFQHGVELWILEFFGNDQIYGMDGGDLMLNVVINEMFYWNVKFYSEVWIRL